MFCLSEEVCGTDFRVCGAVCDDEGFCGSGEEVDSDFSEELSFGFCDEGVTGSDDHIHGFESFCAKSHTADGLDSSEAVDFVSSCHIHGGDDSGMGCDDSVLIFEGRGGSDDARHAGDFGGEHAHVGGRDHGVFSAWHVASDGIDGNMFMTEEDAWQGFDFYIFEGIFLVFCEVSDLFLGK